MKKVFTIIFVILTIIFVWFFGKMLPDIYLNLGKQAYEQRDYVDAYKDLGLAVKLSPKNRDARYYYVKTLIMLKPTLEVQKALYTISQTNLPDSADLISDMQISKWKNQILAQVGENYIEKAPFNNEILRWDVATFPLKVYIQNNSTTAPPYFMQQIQKAFMQWQASTGGLIKFSFVDNEKDANIFVSINPSTDMKKCTQEGCKYTVAYTTPTVRGNLLKKMDIFFYDSNNLGQPFSEQQVYNTALHEIGHSLGIMGHSEDKDNLMYMEESPNNKNIDFAHLRSDFQSISPSDLSTLILLYELIPDITNTPMDKYDTSRQFFAPIVMGDEKTINSQKILEAQNYIKQAPSLPNGYIDLAAAYSESKQFSSAVETLNKALELCSNDNETFIVNYNFAVTYMQVKDWTNALKYAQIAKSLKPSADVDGLIALINYNLGNKSAAKQTYIEALAKTPDNTVDALNLAIIYLKEFDLIHAGHTLNQLVQANPDAKNDPKVRAYSWLMFLFK